MKTNQDHARLAKMVRRLPHDLVVDEEENANARLLAAAAPDLLYVCKAYRESFARLPWPSHSVEWEHLDTLAKDAIHRAGQYKAVR